MIYGVEVNLIHFLRCIVPRKQAVHPAAKIIHHQMIISMISPISYGIERLMPVPSSATNAPPKESGSTVRVATGFETALDQRNEPLAR